MIKMPGYFKIVDKDGKENGKSKYLTVTNSERRCLRNLPKDSKIYCCCNDLNIEMKVSSDLRIYPAKNNTGELHEKSCPKYFSNGKTPLWKKIVKDNLWFSKISVDGNIKDYAIKLNELTKDRLVKSGRMPDNYQEFNRKIWKTQKYILTPYDVSLLDICFTNHHKASDYKTDKEYFLYGRLTDIKDDKYKKNIKVIHIEDYFGKKWFFNIDNEELVKNKFDINNLNLVCGFLIKNKSDSKILSFSDIWITQINKDGTIKRVEEC